MNAQKILNAAFELLLRDHYAMPHHTAHVWDEEEAEHWLIQIAMGQTLIVVVDDRGLAWPALN